jgi:hypothetical protein
MLAAFEDELEKIALSGPLKRRAAAAALHEMRALQYAMPNREPVLGKGLRAAVKARGTDVVLRAAQENRARQYSLFSGKKLPKSLQRGVPRPGSPLVQGGRASVERLPEAHVVGGVDSLSQEERILSRARYR